MSTRKTILKYCADNGIRIPKSFYDLETIYGIALIDVSAPMVPRLVDETFYNAQAVLRFLLDINKHPANYLVLDFKRNTRLTLEHPISLIKDTPIANRTN